MSYVSKMEQNVQRMFSRKIVGAKNIPAVLSLCAEMYTSVRNDGQVPIPLFDGHSGDNALDSQCLNCLMLAVVSFSLCISQPLYCSAIRD